MTVLRYIWLLLFLAPGTYLFGQETDIQFSGNFPDVPFSAWFSSYVNTAAEKKIVKGDDLCR